MAGSLADLFVKIGVNTKEFEKGLGNLDSSLKGFAKNLKGVDAPNLKTIGERATQVGTALTVAGGAGVAAFGLIAREAIQFESAIAGVQKTLGDSLSPKAFEELTDAVQDLSTEIPVAAEELAGIAQIAGQLGVAPENILSFTRTIADLGVATDLTGEAAATMLARFGNVTGQDDYAALGSVIVELGNNFAATESEIAALAARIAGAGTTAGISAEDILSMSAALKSVGLEAEAGGTAMSKLIIELANASASGGAQLENLARVAGTTGAEFSQQFATDAPAAIGQFLAGIKRIDTEGGNVFQVLEDLGLSEVRLRDAILRGAQASDVFTEALSRGRAEFTANNALTKEAGTRYATTESQLKILGNTVAAVAQELGGPLAGAINAAISVARPLLDVVRYLAEEFPVLTGTVVLAGAALSTAAAVFGPLLYGVGSLATALPALTGGLSALSGGAAAAAGAGGLGALGAAFTGVLAAAAPVSAVIVGIGAALYIFRDDIDAAVTGVGVLADKLADDLTPAIEAALESLGSSQAIQSFVGALGDVYLITTQFAKSLAAVIPGVGLFVNTFGALVDIGNDAKVTNAVLEKQGEIIKDNNATIDEWRRAAEGQAEAQDRVREHTEAVRKELEKQDTAKLAEETREYRDSLKELAVAFGEVGDASTQTNFDDQHESLSKIRLSSEEVATWTRILQEQWAGLGAEFVGVIETAADLEAALDQLRSAQEASGEAFKAFFEATREARDTIVSTAEAVEVLGPSFEKAQIEAQSMEEVFRRLPGGAQDVEDAFGRLASKSIAELAAIRDQADRDYRAILESGTATPEQITEAMRNQLVAQRDLLRAQGQELPKEQQKVLDELIRQQEGYTQRSETVFDRWGQRVADIFTGLGAAITDVVFSFFERSEFNDGLREQEDELRASLDAQAAEWDQYQKDASASLDELRRDHAESVSEANADFADGMAERKRSLEDFIYDAQRGLAEFTKDLREREADQIGRIDESLADRELSADQKLDRENFDFVRDQRDAERKLEDIDRDATQRIEDATKKREIALERRKRDLDRYVAENEAKIAELTAADAAGNARQIANLEASIAKRRQDYQDYVDDTAVDLQILTDKTEREAQEQREKVKQSLADRVEDHKRYVDQVRAELERERREAAEARQQIRADNAQRLADERADVAASITARQAEYDRDTEQLKTEHAERLSNLDAALADEEKAIQDSLAERKADFEQFSDDVNAEIASISDSYRTVFGDLKTLFHDVFIKGAGGIISSFVADFLEDKLFKAFGHLIDVIFPGVTKALGKVFSDILGGSIGGAASGAANAGAGAVQGAVGAASGGTTLLAQGLGGLVSAVASSIIGGIFGSGEGDRDLMIGELTQIKKLTDQHLHDVGFFQNDVLQDIYGQLTFINEGINVGDGMKATLWQIRDSIGGLGTSLSNIEITGIVASDAIVQASDSMAEAVEDIPEAVATGIERANATPTRARSAPAPEEEEDQPFVPPGRARTEAVPYDEIVDPMEEAAKALTERNPLAVEAAKAGNPLASLVTGGLFQPVADAVSDAMTEAAATTDQVVSDAIAKSTRVVEGTAEVFRQIGREFTRLPETFADILAAGGPRVTVNVQGSVISEGELVDLIGKELDSRAAVR